MDEPELAHRPYLAKDPRAVAAPPGRAPALPTHAAARARLGGVAGPVACSATSEGADDLAVASPVIRQIVLAAAKRGLAAESLLRDFGITRSQLEDPEHWFAAPLDVRLLNEAAQRAADPCFGLRCGRDAALGQLGSYEYLLARSATLGAALATAIRIHRLLSDSSSLALRVDDRFVSLALHHHPSVVEPTRHASEWLLAMLLVRLRRFAGQPWSPAELRFRHAAPLHTDEHAALFGAPLRFRAADDEMVLDRALLDLPFRVTEPDLAYLLPGLARQQPAPRDFTGRARSELALQLRDGEPSLSGLAGRLRMSPRTLQRRLSLEGISYQALLDSTRRDLAIRCLKDPSTSILDAAFSVGYRSLSTFYLAFRRWTGFTPGEFRQLRIEEAPRPKR